MLLKLKIKKTREKILLVLFYQFFSSFCLPHQNFIGNHFSNNLYFPATAKSLKSIYKFKNFPNNKKNFPFNLF